MNSTVQSLDPKLQETYNRVMGTPTPPPITQKPPPAGGPSPTVASPTTSYVSAKKGLPSWIYLVAGVVFFALYTFFWVRMFNLSLF